MLTTFKTYKADVGMIVFEQSFPHELNLGMSAGYVPQLAPQDDFKCRIVTKNREFALTKSANGYTAYTPSKTGAGFDVHKGDYCDDGHQWSFKSATDSLVECQAKCLATACACMDYVADPVPSPAGATSAQTIFPGFAKAPGPADSHDMFTYHGVFPSMEVGKLGVRQRQHDSGSISQSF